MTARAAVIMAAGAGTRMKSPLPKVLHKVGGRTLLDRVIDTVEALGCERIVVVVGADSAAGRASWWRKRLGAGRHRRPGPAARHRPRRDGGQGRAGRLRGRRAGHQRRLPAADSRRTCSRCSTCAQQGADLALLGFEPADTAALRPADPRRRRPRASGSSSPRTRRRSELAVRACYAGMLARRRRASCSAWLAADQQQQRQGRILPDRDRLARAPRRGARCGPRSRRRARCMGCDTPCSSARPRRSSSTRRRRSCWPRASPCWRPETVHFAWDTQIAPGAMIEPFVVFAPGVAVETGAVIRAFSHLEGAVVRSGAIVGPYARLRPGADIGEDAHIGNFVEVKKVAVGKGAKANHLSLSRRRHGRARARTSAPGRSSATTTASTNSRPTWARAPSSARTRRWWRRSRWAAAPTPAPAR